MGVLETPVPVFGSMREALYATDVGVASAFWLEYAPSQFVTLCDGDVTLRVPGVCDAACDLENVESVYAPIAGRFLRPVSSFTYSDPLFLRVPYGAPVITPMDKTRPVRMRGIFIRHKRPDVVIRHFFRNISRHRTVFFLPKAAVRLLCIARVLIRGHTRGADDTVVAVLQRVFPLANRSLSYGGSLHALTLERIVLVAKNPSLIANWTERQWVEYVVECERKLGKECIDKSP